MRVAGVLLFVRRWRRSRTRLLAALPKENHDVQSMAVTLSLTTLVALGAGAAEAQTQAMRPLVRKSVRPAVIRPNFTCAEDAFTMCLNGHRFEVVATFDTNSGDSGNAEMVRLTDDSGYMWFFAAANIEVVIKVLNGCGLNNEYWVFAGGLTTSTC